MSDTRPRRSPGAHTLPLRLTTFVGRTAELVRLGGDLAGHRLVTLTGPGGAGKSRLAAEVAEHAVDRHVDGVWWVDLAPVSAGGRILGAVAAALGVPDAASRTEPDQLAAFLRDRQVLVVLDNCEHVLAGCAELVGDLLRRCPDVVVLATSRASLGIPGEVVRVVPPLDLPGTDEGSPTRQAASVRLFLDRARAVRPDLRVTPTTLADLDEICRRLEGMPLAIELAAARVQVMTVSQIRTGLDDGFALLAAGPRGVEGRHRTLAACFRWSHDLLAAPERTLLRRLAVFAGAFRLAAVTAVCADPDLPGAAVLDLLASLVDKSLVLVEQLDGEQARYRLPEGIRAFAVTELVDAGEELELRDRHLTHCLTLAAGLDEALNGARARTVTELAADLDDHRAALAHAFARPDVEAVLRLAASVGFLLLHRGRYREVRDLARRALAAGTGPAVLRGRVSWVLGMASWYLDDVAALSAAAQECLRLADECDDVGGRGRGQLLLAWSRFTDGPVARAHLAEALRCAELAGDTWVILEVPGDVGLLALLADDHETALIRCEPAAVAARAAGNDFQLAWVQFCLAACRLRCGEFEVARVAATEAGDLARGIGDRICGAWADYVLAQVELTVAAPAAAAVAADRGLRACAEVGSDQARQGLLAARARAGVALGEPDALAALVAAVGPAERDGSRSEHLRESLALAGYLVAVGDRAGALAAVDAAARSAERMGGPWTAAGIALVRGLLAVDEDPVAAAGHLHDALSTAVEHHLPLVVVDALDALVLVTAVRGRISDAARLLGAVDSRRAALGYPRGPAETLLNRRASDLLAAAPDQVATAASRRAGTDLTIDQAVSVAGRSRGRRGRPAFGWAALTPTEREVAALAAEGLRNVGIGDRMCISPGTVKTHLGRIYAKLGVANRTELGAAARRDP